jgi:hypothetical protein
MPPEPDHPLRPADIKAVAGYVVANIKGKGEPTYTQCQAFFGTGTRVCNTYAKQAEAGSQEASAGASAPAHQTVEGAPDANAPNGSRQ